MIFRKVSVFFAKHSQKVLGFASVVTINAAYLAHPYLEAFRRWSLVVLKDGGDLALPKRLSTYAQDICNRYGISKNEAAYLDLFFTNLDETVSIGSLSGGGYAFIGIPYFLTYTKLSEVSLEDVDFYSSTFPYGPYSPIGQKRLELMVLPEQAVKFLIAREIAKLYGPALLKSTGPSSWWNLVPATSRANSIFVTSSLVGGLYAAYQSMSFLNRRTGFSARAAGHTKVLVYGLAAVVGLAIQHQLTQAWRRHRALFADHVACSLGPDFVAGAKAYYDWRLRWNQFWYQRHSENDLPQDIKSKQQDDDVQLHKLEEEKRLTELSPSGYYVPTTRRNEKKRANNITPSIHKAGGIHGTDRFTATGSERWASDGDSMCFGLTLLLCTGTVWTPLTYICSLLFNPVTSQQRLRQIDLRFNSSTSQSD